MTGQNSIRLHAVILLNLRYQFRFDKFQEFVCATGGGKLRGIWSDGVMVTAGVGLRNAERAFVNASASDANISVATAKAAKVFLN